jgi:TolB-like protein/DNA-binding winged helix-turn-helix (wHTH) protein/Flp pilus assembly protein TadD
VASTPVREHLSIRLGDDYEIDFRPRRLRRGSHVLKLERIPWEILVLLVEHKDEIVTPDEIASRVWGKGVFLDTDNSIRGAIRKLRQALKDDADSPRFIQPVTGQGYRFIALVTPPEEENRTDTPSAEALTVPTNEQNLASEPNGWSQIPRLGLVDDQQDQTAGKGPAAEIGHEISHGQRNWHARKWLLVGAVSLLVLVAGTTYILTRSRPADAKAPKITSLAVLPLKNLSGDPAQEYFADGMTEEVIGRLSMIRGLRVISRTSVMQFKDTRLLAPEIAKKLGVDALVEGSVVREGNRIRVHAQLIRASTDEHFWSEEYDRDLSDVLALQSDVAQAIADKVEVAVSGQERSRLVAAGHVSPEVYESYLKGRTEADGQRSIRYFEDAIKKDPTFAPAYVGLANAYFAVGTPAGGVPPKSVQPKLVSAARKALELDPTLPEPHMLLGLAYQSRWEWSNAEREFKAALELSPNDAWTHVNYARWLLCQGRVEEAQTWARRGRELDPFTVSGHDLGWILFQSRRYDEAIRELRSNLAVYPDDPGDFWFLGYALIAKGAADEAIPVLEKAVALSDRNPAMIGVLVHAYAQAGRQPEAIGLVEELKRGQQKGYVPAAAFVNAYLGLGDKEQAFAWMERAYEEQSMILQYLKVHPFFDPVRDDPRFKDLVRRVGLD